VFCRDGDKAFKSFHGLFNVPRLPSLGLPMSVEIHLADVWKLWWFHGLTSDHLMDYQLGIHREESDKY
jgi:hypothetical protein